MKKKRQTFYKIILKYIAKVSGKEERVTIDYLGEVGRERSDFTFYIIFLSALSGCFKKNHEHV